MWNPIIPTLASCSIGFVWYSKACLPMNMRINWFRQSPLSDQEEVWKNFCFPFKCRVNLDAQLHHLVYVNVLKGQCMQCCSRSCWHSDKLLGFYLQHSFKQTMNCGTWLTVVLSIEEMWVAICDFSMEYFFLISMFVFCFLLSADLPWRTSERKVSACITSAIWERDPGSLEYMMPLPFPVLVSLLLYQLGVKLPENLSSIQMQTFFPFSRYGVI